jgi:branched-chain amino acid transport system substrate-binding protein
MVAGTAALASASVRPRTAPGVSATEVKVGAIVSQSGPVAADFKPYLSGVRAYFAYSNSLGKIHGRTINLAYPLDDASDPSTNITDARTLVTADHAFAIVGVSAPFFNGASYLKSQKTPTFGYAVGNVWGGAKNFFADYGSVLNYNSSIPLFAYAAKMTGSTKVAVVALSFAASHAECKGAITGLQKYKTKIVYSNINEPITTQWGTEAAKIQHSGATMVISCLDVNSNIGLSKALHNIGSDPKQLWLDGYDRSILKSQAAYMDKVYFLLQHVPFEAAQVYPSAFPGLNLYFKEMEHFGYSSDEFSDVALMGWESANLFTQGLRAAGANPTQASLVNAINKIKRDVGGPAGGVTSPINWTIAHTGNTSPACETFVVTQTTGTPTFKLAFNTGPHPWICFPLSGTANLSKPVKPPAGTPGA